MTADRHLHQWPTLPLFVSGAGAVWLCLQAEASPAPPLAVRALAAVMALTPVLQARLADTRLGRVAAAAALIVLITGAGTLPFTYDPSAALGKLLMLAGGMGLATAIAIQPTSRLVSSAALMVAAACGLATYFVATNDWYAGPVKFPALAGIGDAISRALPDLPGPRIHPNVVAGILASLAPWTIALWRTTGMRGLEAGSDTVLVRRAALAASVLMLVGLVFTASRAAWLALLAAGTAVWAGRAIGRPGRGPRVVTAAAAGAVIVMVLLPAASGLLADAVAESGRLTVQSRAMVLVRDYAWIGAGLTTFPLQFAVYGLGGTAAGTIHAHNMAIDVAIEQGLGGLVAMLVLGGAALVAARTAAKDPHPITAAIGEAASLSLIAVALHGMMDDTLYASRGAVILFVPVGFALAAYRGVANARGDRRIATVFGVGAACMVAVAALAAVLPSGRAAWQANVGALLQAQTELTTLHGARSDLPSIHQVRREVSLEAAVARFERSRATVPNSTAMRRLAAIQLARSQYDEARRMLDQVTTSGGDYATRAVVADVMVASGEVDRAAGLLRGDALAADRLLAIAWYRYWITGDRVRAADAWKTVLMLDPGHAQAAEWLEIARTRPDWVNR